MRNHSLLRQIWKYEVEDGYGQLPEYLANRATVTLASFEHYEKHPPVFSKEAEAK